MQRKIDIKRSDEEKAGRKPDYNGAGFAAWLGESKNGRENVLLKDERTGRSVYLFETASDE